MLDWLTTATNWVMGGTPLSIIGIAIAAVLLARRLPLDAAVVAIAIGHPRRQFRAQGDRRIAASDPRSGPRDGSCFGIWIPERSCLQRDAGRRRGRVGCRAPRAVAGLARGDLDRGNRTHRPDRDWASAGRRSLADRRARRLALGWRGADHHHLGDSEVADFGSSRRGLKSPSQPRKSVETDWYAFRIGQRDIGSHCDATLHGITWLLASKRESAQSNCFDRADRVGEVAVGGFLPGALVARSVGITIRGQYELAMNRGKVG